MNTKFFRPRGFVRGRATWLVLSAFLALAYAWVNARAQGPGTGPAVRIDFAGNRPKPAPPASGVSAGVAGPPLRRDFMGSRAMPARSNVSTTPAGSVGAPLRTDFAGSRAKPPAPRN
ncbi:MAG: hypothetical protein LAN61_00400 [Acidobacteriia bacterium]|nr:hypothetical protein [Terriglobia bacterium]